MIEYDEDGNDVAVSGKPPRPVGHTCHCAKRGGLDFVPHPFVNGGGAGQYDCDTRYALPMSKIEAEQWQAMRPITPVRGRRFEKVTGNPGAPNYSNFSINWAEDRITFYSNDGRGKYGTDFAALSDHRDNMTEQQWEAIHNQRAFGKPVTSPRTTTMKIGSEHSVFGELVDVNPLTRTASFKAPNTGEITELSRDMLMEVMEALVTTGAVSRDELARLFGARFPVAPIFKEKIVKVMPSPEEAFESIVEDVKLNPDKGGAWLTRITNGITGALREDNDEL